MKVRCKRTKYYTEEDVDKHFTPKPESKKFLDYEGLVFGELKVIKLHYTKGCHSSWFCRCTCGSLSSVKTNQINQGRDRCTECKFSELSKTKKQSTTRLYNRITIKFPFYKLIDYYKGNSREKWLWYCPECNTPFFKSPKDLLQRTNKVCPCVNTFKDWSQKLREFKIQPILETRGLKFLGWKDSYENSKSFMIVKCPKHKHYSISVNNFLDMKNNYNCPYCEEENKQGRGLHGKHKFVKDSERVHGDKYCYKNYQYIDCRTPSEVYCTLCEDYFEVSYDNHIRGRRGCPSCKGKRYKYSYLLNIKDKSNGNTLAIKFGIATDWRSRITSLKSNNKNTLQEVMYVWEYLDTKSCKAAEKFIKSSVNTHYLDKHTLPDGFTETAAVLDADEIIRLFDNLAMRRLTEEEYL